MFSVFRYLPLFFSITSVLCQGTPFTIDGFIDAGSIKASGKKFNSGGSLSVMGNDITIPDNMQVQFPGTIVSWLDFTNGALDTINGHEVLINGNIINGKIIAAQMQIAGNLAQLSTGTIESMDATTGAIKIKNGPTLFINDPTGTFAPAFTKFPMLAADHQNPSIQSHGGFPMCVAGYKTCPASNRPNGQMIFNVPDATKMVPLAVGDYVTYSGVLFAPKQVAVYSLIANVGTYSEKPGYLFVEDVSIAPLDVTGNALLENGQSRFTGYTTSNTAFVDIFALDVDPCSGNITERPIGTATPERVPFQGRYKWTVPKDFIPVPYTQSYRFRLSTGTTTTKDGFIGGQYDSPVLTWIFPELIKPGAAEPEIDFSQLGFLVNGSGPDGDGNVFRQLSPWPGSNPPTSTTPANCPGAPKVVARATSPAVKAPARRSEPIIRSAFSQKFARGN